MNDLSLTPPPGSHLAQRVLAGVAAVLFTVCALMAIRQLFRGLDPLGATLGAASGLIAILCWWVALRAHIAESRARMQLTLKGGIIVGGVMDEEYLFWDNQAFMKQIGLGQ
jgi:hypothetical protein